MGFGFNQQAGNIIRENAKASTGRASLSTLVRVYSPTHKTSAKTSGLRDYVALNQLDFQLGVWNVLH